MKRILSIMLALVMIVGMIPMSILTASAATATATITFDDTAKRTTFNASQAIWEEDGVTVTNNKASGNDIADYSNPARFYKGSELIIAYPQMTKIEVTCGSSSYATALANSTFDSNSKATANGSVVTITLTATADTVTVTMGAQARVKSMTVTYSSVDSGECAHTNTEVIEAVAATCTTAGNTAGTKCADCGTVLSGNEFIAALGHTNDAGVVTAPTCTEDGYTLYTCTVCGSTKKDDYVDATGHTYDENGVCSACGIAKPAALDGKYYIAAKRSSGNYFYMTVNKETEKDRFVAVDSGLTELPAEITAVENTYVIELVSADNGYKVKVGDQYLGWSSGNTAILVAEDAATVATVEYAQTEGAYNIHFTATDAERYLALNNTTGNNYFLWYKDGQADDLYLIPVSENAEACTHANTTTTTVNASCGVAGSTTVTCDDCKEVISTTEIPALEHNYVDGTCSNCGEAEPAEDVKVVFELGEDKDTTTHADGSGATAYSETVGGYTLSITGGVKMYTSANDAKGNGCIKLGTSSAAGSFSFTAPDDVTAVVINVAGYKATAAKISINSGDTQTISTYSNNGEYTAIEIDTSTTKTISFTTVSGGYRAMVNSIEFICGETDHTCVWGEGVVTTPATCTTEGVMTYTCTVDGCTKTEVIKATGHTYVYGESAITCSACDYNAAYTLNTIAEAKAYTSTSQVYYIKGIVTYVSGKNVYIEDATGAVCVYFDAAPSDIVLGDEILVWDTMTAYNGLIETSNTTSQEYVKASSGNALPSQTVTLADLLADTANEYLCERVTIEGLTIGVLGTNNTALTAADGSTINIYKAPALSENINENDTVTVTAIVSTHNGYQLLINPGTAATDVVETAAGEEEVVTTVTIAEAKAGTAGEYYQVEGTVTYISGRNVYIQDATGGIVVYLIANAATTQVGDNVKAYGALKVYNGLIELDAVDETNAEFYSILSSGNAVEAQQTSIAGLLADTTNEYLAEKVTLNNVYVSHYSYNSSYGNVTYTLTDGNGNTIQIYRVTVASEAECVAKGSIVNVEAVVSAFNGYQLVTTNDKITVTGTCAHETTQLVNYVAATCTEGGYSGDTECVVCGVWTVRGEDTAALGHSFTENGTCANNCGTRAVIVMNGEYYTSFDDANAAYDGHPMKLLANIGENGPVTLTKTIYVDLNGYYMYAVSSTANCTVYGMDSSTDSYEAEEWGVLNVTGATVASITNTYLAIDEGENNWSFHAFSVELKYVSLDPANDALGYKAQFFGDEAVQAQVESFGFNLWLTSDRVVSKSVEKVENGQIVTLRLKNIFANNGSRMPIFAEAFVTFKNTETVKTETNNTSMMAAFQAVNEALTINPAAYNATQIGLLQGLIERYEGQMEGWEISAIKEWTAPGV